MKRIARTDNWIKCIKRSGQRFRREGRRLCSVFLCASLVAGNCAVTPFSAFAEDESGEYEYEFERASLKAAIREAVAEGALDQELNLIGTYADEYAELLEADGSLYEVFSEIIDEDRDRDRVLDLRIFARIEGSIPVDDTYVFDGSEELIFLLENKTDQIQTAAIRIDGMWTDEIEVLPAASVAVDGESGGPGVVAGAAAAETDAVVTGDAVISGGGAISGGSVSGSGGSSGGSGSNGSSSGSSVNGSKSESADETISGSESDLTEEYADGLNHEVTADDSDPDKTESDDLDGVEESQGAESDHLDGDRADITDGQKTEDDANGSVTDGTDDTTEEGSGTSGVNADADAGESGDDDDDELDAGDTSGEEVEGGSGNNSEEAGETSDEDDEISDDGDNTDTGSDETDDSDGDTAEDSSSDTSSENSSGSDTGDTAGGSEEDASGNDSTSGQTASISLHRTAYLSAPLATDSNVEKRATPSDATSSDAEHSIDGELLNAVLLDGHGAVAFVTTAADLKLDVIMLSEQELTCESEDGDQDYLVTVTGWLPDGGFVTAEPVDVEIEGKTVLLALDISIYDDNGEIYEPAEDTISVKITSSEIASEETGSNYDVYYVPEEGEPELVTVTESEEGDVTFEAEHFSVYAVTSSDSVIASGTIDNADGVADAISWTLYEDDAGNRYLHFEGSGAIPDYATENSGQPWYSYRSTLTTIVFDEGITGVGSQAFHGWNLKEIVFPSTMKSLGYQSFSYLSSLTSVTIPGTLKTIGNSAFIYSYALVDITLEEGVETIGNSAFGSQASGSTTITIPASVTSIGSRPFWAVSGYEVAEGNEYYCAVDSVLYSKDMTQLVDYPGKKVADSYTIPASVETVLSEALMGVYYTKEMYVTENTDVSFVGYAFRISNFTYVYVADGVNISGGLMFYSMPNLTEVRLPENTVLNIGNQYFNPDAQLTSLKIPNGTTSIGNLALSGATNLETLVYDAADASINAGIFGTSALPMFDLTIGANVESLPANFSYILAHANSVSIEGANAFYVTEGAFDNAPAPYTGISGWLYVDEYGAVYTLDTDNHTAALIYVPEDVTSYTVPAAVTVSGREGADGSYAVVTVASHALKYAEKLTSLIFEDASVIQTLEAYALANAPLTSVSDEETGKTAYTVTAASALFAEAAIGYNIFYNTKLGEAEQSGDFAASMNGQQSVATSGNGTGMVIEVKSGKTTEWTASADDETEGGYTSLTGDTVTFVTSVSNTTGSLLTYRVYFQVTEDDCVLDCGEVGEEKTVNGVTYTVCGTDDPYTIYLEFVVEAGETKSFSVGAVYSSPTSDGGGVTVWGAVAEETADGTQTESEQTGTIQAWWETLPDTYTLDKTNSNQTSITIAADDDGTVRPTAELKYIITLTSEGESSTYGKDYVTTASYTDVLTLPDGMEWDEEVLDAIASDSITRRSNTLYLGTVKIAAVSLGDTSGLSLGSLAISLDSETGKVSLTWKVRNTSGYNMNTNKLNLYIYPDALIVDPELYSVEADNEILNTASVRVNYTYSAAKEAEAGVKKAVTGGSGTVKLLKTEENDVTYFGEDVTYRVKVYNNGALTYTGANDEEYTLTDALAEILYISPDNMELMFEEAAQDGTTLVITIKGAKLGTGGLVTDTDGSADSAAVNTGNSDLSDESEDHTLTITYHNGATEPYMVTVDEESAVSGSSLGELLQGLGYGVTRSATYTCVWTLPMTEVADGDESGTTVNCFTLTGGQNYTYDIYATVKSTFQILDDSDWPGEYPKTSALSLTNTAVLTYKDSSGKTQTLRHSPTADSVKREAVITKSVAKDGVDLGSAPEASDGDVLDYTLTFYHYGDGAYEDLPMVDDIYGSQYLLVPVKENDENESIQAGLASGNVEIYTDTDNTEYYKLGEGTYTDVKVGNWDGTLLTAAEITVDAASGQTFTVNDETYTWSGTHTQIKWYFASLEGGEYTIDVTYQVLVDTTGYEADYTIGNLVWMNDRTGSRIYAGLWGGGTIIGYDKDIVVNDEDTNISKVDQYNNATGTEGADGFDDDKHSSVFEGESVTYCLTLESTGTDGSFFTLTGKNIADQLPDTYGTFEWSTSNVSIDRVEVASGTVSDTESLIREGNWSVGTEYNSIKGDGIYFILWSDDISVTFYDDAKIYVYVTLTFPSDSDLEGGSTEWSDYADAAGGTTLANTFYVYRNPANVTHVLAQEGSAVLQKGVYELARSSTNTVSQSGGTYYLTGSSRDYYNNQDSNYRYVLYYSTLYNGASTRLYINDLYDVLPQGFTYVTMFNSNAGKAYDRHFTNTSVVTTETQATAVSYRLVEHEDGVTYKSATVSAYYDADSGQIRFVISQGNGDDAVSYDEERGQYYLDSAEAIVFGFICQIGTSDETGDGDAVNTIAMSYTDYTGAGVAVDDMRFVSSELEQYQSRNDGDCDLSDADTMSENYGVSDGTGNSQWLVSDVTLQKGGIKPGIIKETVSYQVNEESEAVAYTNSVNYNYLVNWQVTLQNGGDMSIVDYTVTDVMPSPYVFTGAVTYAIYDSGSTSIDSGTFCTFPNASDTTALSDGDTVTVYTGISTTNTADITVGGEAVTITASTLTNSAARTYTIRLYLDDNGNLVMEIGLEDVALAIPEGGYVVMNFTSYNPTNIASNETYINQVTMTTSQSFDKEDIQSGSAVANDDDNIIGVSSKSPVTVSTGYSTDSYKTVTEKADSTNTAASNGTENVIVLPGADSIFTYTLYVENVNDQAITKMVLIDNLPQTDDYYTYNNTIERDSAFTVALASDEFTVSLLTAGTDADGNERTSAVELGNDDYTVEWSSFVPTEDSVYSEEDRKGGETGGSEGIVWETLDSVTDLSEVRSIRIVINTEIPAHTTVAISFDAGISGNADPGCIAWNNFGYGYQIGSNGTWLEAMPLEVGVKIPSVPELTKKLVGLDGNAYTTAEGETFTFVVYQGEEIKNSGSSYTTQSELTGALDTAERSYRVVTVTVNEEFSESEKLIMTGSNGLGTDAEGQINWWTWEDGELYTIVEFLNDNDYSLWGWSSGSSVLSETSSYTFTYHAASTLSLVCTNICEKWSLKLTKVDKDSRDKTLQGAVFALYTQDENQKIANTDYQELILTYQLDDEYIEGEGDSAVTWYLYGVEETNSNGELSWSSLTGESYYLVEIKAPDGYNLNVDGYVVIRDPNTDYSEEGFYEVTWISNEGSITVTNEAGSELPETGGPGTLPFRVAGLLLMSVSAYLIYDTLKRRRISSS